MKILVTGGAGFIGQHLVKRLLSDGHEVIVIDHAHDPYLPYVKPSPVFKYIKKDIGQINTHISNFEVDLIYHLAATVSIHSCENHVEDSTSNNVNQMLEILQFAKKNKTPVVFASSAAVYANTGTTSNELMRPIPSSAYGIHKYSGEMWLQHYARKYDVPTCSLRFFNVYGIGQNPEYAGVITKFCEAFEKGESPTIHGLGKQSRDFIHVSDVVEALILTPQHSSMDGSVYNIGTGRDTTVRELLRLICNIYKKVPKINIETQADPGVMFSRADVTLAERVLGFTAKTRLFEGLEELIYARNPGLAASRADGKADNTGQDDSGIREQEH